MCRWTISACCLFCRAKFFPMLLMRAWACISILSSIFSTFSFSIAAGDAGQREAGTDPILNYCGVAERALVELKALLAPLASSLPRAREPGHVLQDVLSAQSLCFHCWQSTESTGMSKCQSVPGAEMILLALLLNVSFEPNSGLSHTGSRALTIACMNEMTNSAQLRLAQLRLAQLMLSRSAQLSSCLPRQHLPPQLFGSEEYARDSLLALMESLIRHFLLSCQLLLLPLGLFSLPYSVSSLLPPETLIRNEVEGGRSKNNCTERISGI